MLHFKNILVPLDFDEGGEGLAAAAAQLASRFNAKLHLLHAIDLTLGVDVPPGCMRTMIEESEEQLERLGERFARYGFVVATRMENPALFIQDYLRSTPIDLVLMTTHGRKGLARMVVGSTTERVIRHAACPVLTLPYSACVLPDSPRTAWLDRPRVDGESTGILVPADWSGSAREAVERAAELAHEYGGRLHLLHVVEEAALKPPGPYADDRSRMVLQTVRRLEQLSATAREQEMGNVVTGLACAHAVRFGAPATEIARYARENGVQLIVMATGRKTALERLWPGSVTAGVLRRAPCAVFSMTHPERSLYGQTPNDRWPGR